MSQLPMIFRHDVHVIIYIFFTSLSGCFALKDVSLQLSLVNVFA